MFSQVTFEAQKLKDDTMLENYLKERLVKNSKFADIYWSRTIYKELKSAIKRLKPEKDHWFVQSSKRNDKYRIPIPERTRTEIS